VRLGDMVVVVVDWRWVMLELAFDETFLMLCHLELYHKPIQEFFMIKTSQRELLMICIVMVKQYVKSLDAHTHIIAY